MIKKLGMVVLWSCVIIYGVYIFLLLFFKNIIGLAILAVLAIIVIAFKLYRNRYKISFKRQVKMLSKVCEKSPNDSQIIPEEQFTESFDSANFFIHYKPETQEFFFSSYYYIILPDCVETWNKAGRNSRILLPRKPPIQKSK